MRELWLAQTGAQPQLDELLARTPVPDGYDQTRYKGSGLSSHLRLHLTKMKKKRQTNVVAAWREYLKGQIDSTTSTFLLHLEQVHF